MSGQHEVENSVKMRTSCFPRQIKISELRLLGCSVISINRTEIKLLIRSLHSYSKNDPAVSRGHATAGSDPGEQPQTLDGWIDR